MKAENLEERILLKVGEMTYSLFGYICIVLTCIVDAIWHDILITSVFFVISLVFFIFAMKNNLEISRLEKKV